MVTAGMPAARERHQEQIFWVLWQEQQWHRL